jgi:hypothetical protein
MQIGRTKAAAGPDRAGHNIRNTMLPRIIVAVLQVSAVKFQTMGWIRRVTVRGS